MKTNEELLSNDQFVQYFKRFVCDSDSITKDDIEKVYSNVEINKLYNEVVKS
jgi:hypothetical protein